MVFELTQPGIKATTTPISGQGDRVSTTETIGLGSIPGWVKPKTLIIGIPSFELQF